ncbi:MAG: excinuclease ABC subunit UvrA, partial [Opitutales bacterium]|nr:excinuclease ABC subunit UvrA [Opitutales bacterium]
LSTAFACEKCATIYQPLTVQSFSFNHPNGACKYCGGIGRVMRTNPKLAIPDETKSIKDGAIKAWRIGSKSIIIMHNRIMRQLAEQYPFSLTTPWKDLPEEIRNFLLYGDKDRIFSLRIRRGNTRPIAMTFDGILADVDRICFETSSDSVRARLSTFQTISICPECNGARLSARSRNVFVEDVSYDKFCSMSVGNALKFISKLVDNKKYAPVQDAVKGLYERLTFLEEVGLSYIGLDREASTLSGGEAQRARLATQLGMDLTGVTYVLDEPTIGLHKSDNFRLINAIQKLKSRGNTVLLVEHDEDALNASDWIVELGKDAGEKGGELVFNGSVEACKQSEDSRTGMYLSGRKKIERPAPQLKLIDKYLTIKNASENNLKNINVKFPIGLFTVVCGVSGSGKSTLVNDILAKAAANKLNGAKEISGRHGGILGLENFTTCVRVDQSPIGKSPRSNPATYTKLFDLLRELYAQCPLSKARGYQAGRFSFNVKGGRCENCQGDGCIHLDMQFLGDVFVTCPSCNGKRYNRETLEVRYKGLNIAEALNLTVDEALEVFGAHPKILAKLQTLKDVGLGYIRLGQASNTLSGGEAQSIKLSLELSRRTRGQALYILDEPTTGLHWDDVDKLLKLLFKLRDAGNTIIVIEHHPDFIRLADYLIELGPTGGEKGGYLLTKQ